MGSGGISTGRAGGGVAGGQRLPNSAIRVGGDNPGAQNVEANRRSMGFIRGIRSAPQQPFESNEQFRDRQRGAGRLRSSVLSVVRTPRGAGRRTEATRVGTTPLFRFRGGAAGGAGGAARQRDAVLRFLSLTNSTRLSRVGRRGSTFAVTPSLPRVARGTSGPAQRRSPLVKF